jgi:hypothetical protein
MDSHVFAKYSHDLLAQYTAGSTDQVLQASTAYRKTSPPKSNIDHALEAFTFLREHPGHTAIALDISGFFDNLDHRILKRAWAGLIGHPSLPPDHYAVFKAATRFSAISRERLREILGRDVPRRISREASVICSAAEFREVVAPEVRLAHQPNIRGIPQGLPISGMLANVYMIDFDQRVSDAITRMGGIFRRYSDDILAIVPHSDASGAEDFIEARLREIRLSSNPSKTNRARYLGGGRLVDAAVDQPECTTSLQYLGLEWDGSQVRLRNTTMSRFTKRLRNGVRRAARAARKSGEVSIRRRQLFARYSHLGRPSRIFKADASSRHGNFVSYARRAQRKCEAAGFPSIITRQWGKQWISLNERIQRAEAALRDEADPA